MNASQMYQCPRCPKTHPAEEAAVSCCPPRATKVWVCGECNATYSQYSEARAMKCCQKAITAADREAVARFCVCGVEATAADIHDSKILGSLVRCRACILKVAPELVAA